MIFVCITGHWAKTTIFIFVYLFIFLHTYTNLFLWWKDFHCQRIFVHVMLLFSLIFRIAGEHRGTFSNNVFFQWFQGDQKQLQASECLSDIHQVETNVIHLNDMSVSETAWCVSTDIRASIWSSTSSAFSLTRKQNKHLFTAKCGFFKWLHITGITHQIKNCELNTSNWT